MRVRALVHFCLVVKSDSVLQVQRPWPPQGQQTYTLTAFPFISQPVTLSIHEIQSTQTWHGFFDDHSHFCASFVSERRDRSAFILLSIACDSSVTLFQVWRYEIILCEIQCWTHQWIVELHTCLFLCFICLNFRIGASFFSYILVIFIRYVTPQITELLDLFNSFVLIYNFQS